MMKYSLANSLPLTEEDRNLIRDELKRSSFGAKLASLIFTLIFGGISFFNPKPPIPDDFFTQILFTGFIYLGLRFATFLLLLLSDWSFRLDKQLNKKVAVQGEITEYQRKNIRLKTTSGDDVFLCLKGCTDLDPKVFTQDDIEPDFSRYKHYSVEYLPRSKVALRIQVLGSL